MSSEAQYVERQLCEVAIYALRDAADGLKMLPVSAVDSATRIAKIATRDADIAFLRRLADGLEKKITT